MNDLGMIALGAGLRDGLNPCIFMSSAVFIAGEWGLPQISLRAIWLRIVFGLTYLISALNFNFGPAQIFVLRKDFIFTAKIIYFILGAGIFILGILFFKDWFLLSRGQIKENPGDKRIKIPALLIVLITIILSVLLSALATVWPVNNYIFLLGNEGMIKGEWQSVLPLLATYVLMNMWPIWFVWAFLSVKNLRPSLLKIFSAAIFFIASSCMMLIFK